MTKQNLQCIVERLLDSENDELDMADVQREIAKHPEYAKELMQFAGSWMLLSQGDEREQPVPQANLLNEDAVQRVVNRVTRQASIRLDNLTHEAVHLTNPFKPLSTLQIRELAADLHLPKIILLKLRDRQISWSSMPDRLCGALTEKPHINHNVLRTHLLAAPYLASTSEFRSQRVPDAGTAQQSFDQALRATGDEKAIAYWLGSDSTTSR